MAAGLRLEVAHAVLYVHDVDTMIEFYTNILGFEVTDRGPFSRGDEIVFLSQTANAHHQLAFITGRGTPERSNNVNHVAFRSEGTLDDLRSLKKTLQADGRVTEIMPLTHGNAWSVYFRDPELNGVEVFIDTPWHVRQPQGQPLDLDKSNDEIVESTRDHFSTEPEFGSIDDFYRARAARLNQP
ncbi:MAG TPA: VOC family protein [Ilumatobacteraceae bacterium]|nr:VOC family protein [Ilumatobacteraceae bacterium]